MERHSSHALIWTKKAFPHTQTGVIFPTAEAKCNVGFRIQFIVIPHWDSYSYGHLKNQSKVRRLNDNNYSHHRNIGVLKMEDPSLFSIQICAARTFQYWISHRSSFLMCAHSCDKHLLRRLSMGIEASTDEINQLFILVVRVHDIWNSIRLQVQVVCYMQQHALSHSYRHRKDDDRFTSSRGIAKSLTFIS